MSFDDSPSGYSSNWQSYAKNNHMTQTETAT